MFADAACTTGETEEGFGGGGGGSSAFGLSAFLKVTVAAIRQDGWLSRTKARDEGRENHATAATVMAELTRKNDRPIVKIISEEDGLEAERLLKFVTDKFDAVNPESLSDYEHNLRVVVVGGYVTYGMAGIAASLINYARREEAAEIERKLQSATPKKHVGTLGDRVTMILTVTGMHTFETNYGSSTWCNFRDADGNRIVWKASGCPSYEETDLMSFNRPKVGTAYEVMGTIEKHGMDRRDGVTPETILKRCKMGAIGYGVALEAQKVADKAAKKVAAREARAAAKKAKTEGTGEAPVSAPTETQGVAT